MTAPELTKPVPTKPVLTTRRLTLRLPDAHDFDAFADFVAQDRSRWVGGPGTREDARDGFEDNLAHWTEHGFGYFHVIEAATGRVLGRAGIRTSGHRPEPEIAYSLYREDDEGQGFAREAAEAVRDWGFATLGLASLVSYIDPANTRSRAVAEAMGARADGTAPGWDKHPGLIVYRHPRPAQDAICATVPVLTTERLTLRAPRAKDFDAFAAFYSSDRSWGSGGPLDRPAAWRGFAAEIGHWVIHGYGNWIVEVTDTGETVGQVGFWNPEGWREVEIGWAMYEGSEGKGYAFAAARCARDYAYDSLGWGPLTSVIAPGNTRSETLATRLGAHPERDWVSPSGKPAVIWRHPGRGAWPVSGGREGLA